MVERKVSWRFGENPTSWRHLTSFDVIFRFLAQIFPKSADVSWNCPQIWLLNIDFRKENLCTFKMRGRPFPYDNWFKNYRFFNFSLNYDVIMTSWRQIMMSYKKLWYFLKLLRTPNYPTKFHPVSPVFTVFRQGGSFYPPHALNVHEIAHAE